MRECGNAMGFGHMSVLLGIGSGPIQTGIFVSGASRCGFARIVLADVDCELVEAVRKSGTLTVNTAERDRVRTDTYDGIAIYNPADAEDAAALKAVAATADAICTALPSTALYRHVAPWLTDAFDSAPDRCRFVYTAENSTTAADELMQLVGAYAHTHYLDTVIGKMSKVFNVEESDLPPLAPGFDRGHLVEAFNDIYTASAPGVDELGIEGLYPKAPLHPFEEAKLYGHNTTHFMLAALLHVRGCRYMDQAADHPATLALARHILVDECGAALCRKHAGMDPFFDPETFACFAHGLVERMTSPVLRDSVERVIRDPERKLGWSDRMIGAVRLCLSQAVYPVALARVTVDIAAGGLRATGTALADKLVALWNGAPPDEIARVRACLFET